MKKKEKGQKRNLNRGMLAQREGRASHSLGNIKVLRNCNDKIWMKGRNTKKEKEIQKPKREIRRRHASSASGSAVAAHSLKIHCLCYQGTQCVNSFFHILVFKYYLQSLKSK